MKARLIKYPLSLIALLLTILCLSCAVPTKQPSYFDKHPNVLKKQYTADEIAILEKNFAVNPLQYSQAFGDMLLWQMHQKSPEFALEFAQIPEIADEVNAQEVRAMNSILQLIKSIEITKDLYDKRESDSDVHKIIMQWKGNEESDWSGWFLGLGNTNYSSGKILTAEPITFEAEDAINQEYLRRYQDLKWKSVSRKGDTGDGIIFKLQSPMHKELTFYINGKQLKLTPADLLKEDLVFDDKDGLDGKLTIKNGYQSNLTPELFAIRDMVLAGEGEHRYSSPLQALLWGYMDGKFKEGDNPLKNYQGALEFVKPIWGDMKGERWDGFDEVARRVNSPELFDYWVNKSIRYGDPRVGHTKSATSTFKDLVGDCSDVAELGEEMLGMSGYDVIKICTTDHVMGLLKENDSYWVVIDFGPMGNYLRGPSKNLYELTGGATFECPPFVEP